MFLCRCREPLCLFDDLQPQCLAEFGKRFLDVAVDGYPMPAELVPLVEQLADVSGDFADQLGPAAVLAVERADGCGPAWVRNVVVM